MTGFFSRCVVEKIVGFQPKLRPDEIGHLFRDDLAGSEDAPRISKSAELQGKAKLVVRTAALLDVFEIVSGQSIDFEKRGFVCRQVQQCRPLPIGQNSSSRHSHLSQLIF